jgi:hypothetical protein
VGTDVGVVVGIGVANDVGVRVGVGVAPDAVVVGVLVCPPLPMMKRPDESFHRYCVPQSVEKTPTSTEYVPRAAFEGTTQVNG